MTTATALPPDARDRADRRRGGDLSGRGVFGGAAGVELDRRRLAVVLAAVALWTQHGPAAAGGPLNLDALAWHGRWLALGFGALLRAAGVAAAGVRTARPSTSARCC